MLPHILLLTSIILVSATTGISGIKFCPPASAIEPCLCLVEEETDDMHLDCLGQSEEHVYMVIERILKINHDNGLEPGELLNVTNFWIWGSAIEKLDLVPFFQLRMENFMVDSNPWFRGFFVSVTPPPDTYVQVTNSLSLYKNNLTDDSFPEVLQYICKDLTAISLGLNQFTGGAHEIGDGSGDIELLPGLSAFTKLEFLSVEQNLIRVISGGQFKRHANLVDLHVSGQDEWDYPVEFGVDAFAFNEPTDETWLNRKININFEGNYNFTLTPNGTSFSSQRPIHLDLEFCALVSLPEDVWGPILRGNPQNSMNLQYNRLHCDSTMKWLKDGRAEFEPRVTFADCRNDEGFTVFTSNLIN